MTEPYSPSRAEVPRGFVLSDEDIAPPKGFSSVEVLPNLYVTADQEISTASSDGLVVVVLGLAISHSVSSVAEYLLESLREGENQFFSRLGETAGRYAVFFGSSTDLKVVSDATATRSIFYRESGGLVASHAYLVSALEPKSKRVSLPFGNGFPGNFTPFEGVKILTANFVLDVNSGRINRYWPINVARKKAADPGTEILELVTDNLKQMAKGRRVKLALTAGIDSRLVLACALSSGIDFEAFTYGKPSGGVRIDHLVAAEIARKFGIAHTSVEAVRSHPDFLAAVNRASYTRNHIKAVQGLAAYFGDNSTIGLNGNLLELGRDHYELARELSEQFEGAELATEIYWRKLPKRFRDNISANRGIEAYKKQTFEYFEAWLSEIGGFQGGYYPAHSQFYWEHRMASWNGPFSIERDFYCNFVVPFNSHRIFELFWDYSEVARRNREPHTQLIEKVDQHLLDIPINPRVWPLA